MTTLNATQALTCVDPVWSLGDFTPLHTDKIIASSMPSLAWPVGIWTRTTLPGLSFPHLVRTKWDKMFRVSKMWQDVSGVVGMLKFWETGNGCQWENWNIATHVNLQNACHASNTYKMHNLVQFCQVQPSSVIRSGTETSTCNSSWALAQSSRHFARRVVRARYSALSRSRLSSAIRFSLNLSRTWMNMEERWSTVYICIYIELYIYIFNYIYTWKLDRYIYIYIYYTSHI